MQRIERLEQTLTCSVCRLFPTEPMECVQCGSLSCETCMSQMSDPSNNMGGNCWTCRTSSQFRVATAVRSMIRNAVFKCAECSNDVVTGDREVHVRLCERRVRKCPFCVFQTRDQSEATGHLSAHPSQIHTFFDKFTATSASTSIR